VNPSRTSLIASTPLGDGDRACDVTGRVRVARLAQPGWAATPLKVRLKMFRRFRALAAEHAANLAALSSSQRERPLSEALTAEVVPLLESVKFLEREATQILSTRRLGRRGRPKWLLNVDAEIRREPLGVVLVIGPSNYPLFLPAVQALQALVAGNSVLVKPGMGGSKVMQTVMDLLHHAGLDHRLMQILPEASSAAAAAIDAGVDKVVLTGAAETGTAVLGHLAHSLTPAVMELSGCDAVFIRGDADLDLVVRSLRFGTLLNNGATCIAPRRVFVHQSVATELEGRLARAFAEDTAQREPLRLKSQWTRIIHEALSGGAHLVSGHLEEDGQCHPPLVLAGALPEMRLLQNDVFAPVMSLVTVADDHEAIEISRHCPYALGATIFGRSEREARRLADRIDAGVIVVNDIMVPTADPRLPFAGRHRSGFGSTRGAEGLLEMTSPKGVTVRRGSWRPHLDSAQPGDVELFENFLRATNALNWCIRCRAGVALMRGLIRRRRPGASGPDSAETQIRKETNHEQ
jgi:acyl-CoA reductase-like NAD-dependent aldehyde dehydrogenase